MGRMPSFWSARARIAVLGLASCLAACMPAGGGSGPPGAGGTADGGASPDPGRTGRNGGRTDPALQGPDADADGLPDDEEARLGTDPHHEDTDGDGVNDGVEVLAGTDPARASSTIPATDFYVVLPFEAAPEVRELEFSARLGRGDVFFLVDTTGSMGLAISSVRESLSSTIVPALEDNIADVVMGVGDFRDFPLGEYGSAGDWSFQLRQEMTADVSRVQSALNGLRAGGGGDTPESALEGLYEAAAGRAPCRPAEGFGAACFRHGSHPIVVVVTDAPIHNGPRSEFRYDSSVSARTWNETIGALNDGAVKVVGAAVEPIDFPFGFGLNFGREDLEAVARDTRSRAVGGDLTVYDAPGGEVSGIVVDGILDLVGAETQDVTSIQHDDRSDGVDATRFIRSIRPSHATRSIRSDETTFYGVGGGTTVGFEVTFENDFVPQEAYVQIFEAEIELVDLPDENRLDLRHVYVVVPAIGGTLI